MVAYKEFPGLSPHAFQHPLDSQATGVLKQNRFLADVVRFISENGVERIQRIHLTSSAIEVSERQYPGLYREFVRIARILDVRKLPKIFIMTTSGQNAYASGMEDYIIVLESGLLDMMNERERLAIIGHELGHVKCEHQLYKTLGTILMRFGAPLLKQLMPVGAGAAATLFESSLLEWNRKAEFSCDRAALLGTQDEEGVCGALAKLAGYSVNLGEDINLDAVVEQAGDFEEIGSDSIINRLIKIKLLSGQTHPHPVTRVKEIRNWARSEEYRQILAGNYRREKIGQLGNGVKAALATPKGVVCPKCGAAWAEGTNFCAGCATNLRGGVEICGRCHLPVRDEWRNCPGCGNGLKPRLLKGE